VSALTSSTVLASEAKQTAPPATSPLCSIGSIPPPRIRRPLGQGPDRSAELADFEHNVRIDLLELHEYGRAGSLRRKEVPKKRNRVTRYYSSQFSMNRVSPSASSTSAWKIARSCSYGNVPITMRLLMIMVGVERMPCSY